METCLFPFLYNSTFPVVKFWNFRTELTNSSYVFWKFLKSLTLRKLALSILLTFWHGMKPVRTPKNPFTRDTEKWRY